MLVVIHLTRNAVRICLYLYLSIFVSVSQLNFVEFTPSISKSVNLKWLSDGSAQLHFFVLLFLRIVIDVYVYDYRNTYLFCGFERALLFIVVVDIR